MTFNEFLQKVEQARSANPLWFELDSDEPAEENEITLAESELGVIFPEDYKSFVRTFGGGYFAFSAIFSVRPHSRWYIVDKNRDLNLATSKFLKISDNGMGDSYGFKLDGNICAPNIAFEDHETGEISVQFVDLFEYLLAVGLER